MNEYNSLCDDDLDILLNHSKYEGILNYKECDKVFKALEKLEFKYDDAWRQDWKEQYYILKDMLKYCAENKEVLYFR